MRLDDEQWIRLARELGRSAARVVPSWTEGNAHDPGVAMATLSAFLAEQLACRSDGIGSEARAQVRRLARHAAALAAAVDVAASDDCDRPGLRRNRYFAGRLLQVEDLQAEQDYVIGRLNRRNRLLHGAGIVAGLQVTVEPGEDGGPAVVVAPGLAFDPAGREIHLDSPCRLPLPASDDALGVWLRFDEQPCRSVPAMGEPSDGADGTAPAQPSRIVETFIATLSAAPDDEAVAVGRVQRHRGRWRLDPRFEPIRARR